MHWQLISNYQQFAVKDIAETGFQVLIRTLQGILSGCSEQILIQMMPSCICEAGECILELPLVLPSAVCCLSFPSPSWFTPPQMVSIFVISQPPSKKELCCIRNNKSWLPALFFSSLPLFSFHFLFIVISTLDVKHEMKLTKWFWWKAHLNSFWAPQLLPKNDSLPHRANISCQAASNFSGSKQKKSSMQLEHSHWMRVASWTFLSWPDGLRYIFQIWSPLTED